MSDESKDNSEFDWAFWLVLVVGLAAAAVVAIPNFIRARSPSARTACIANLKQIDGAVQQWALESKLTATDTYSLSDTTVLAYLKGSVLPVCPEGGRYLPGINVAASPRCTIGGLSHSL